MIDGHIHSPYCPHGSSDTLKAYVEHAIQLGYDSLTFTEHAPLPESFEDPVPEKDSGMNLSQTENYIKAIEGVKQTYKNEIHVNIGFEIDFIEGYETETSSFLHTYGPYIEDSILSVHFLKGETQWYCIDYSPNMYKAAVKDFQTNAKLYEKYFQTVAQSVKADLGCYKPKRVGHITLVRKFQKLFPAPAQWESYAVQLLKLIKEYQLELDYNGAGMQKTHCKETYPPLELAEQAFHMGIPLIYGSDAHASSQLQQGFSHISKEILSV